ncbi:MAG TPA: TetR/AcrR family transcriptional regulator C-terminal domain-containing protein [Gaiellaceae bacterium]|nr:TetR/AcrR family transcriptional regulator C-terminal domain-containing protein [Gaiellaceae bacterium]
MPLSRDQILAAAVTLADREGLEVVSMRRLGRELGVQAMSLYNHVPSKDAILDGMVERVLAEVELPEPGDWETSVRRCAVSTHDALLRHPWACALVMVPASGPEALLARLRYIEALLRAFRESGFSARQASYAYHAIDSHALGFTMWQLGHAVPADATVARVAMDAVGGGAYPYVLEHSHEHEVQSGPSSFEYGLDLIFEGLRRMRGTEEASVPFTP